MSNIVTRLRHGIVTELLNNLWVRKTATDGRIKYFKVTAKRLFCLGKDKRRTRHRLDPTRQNNIPFMTCDTVRSIDHSRQT